MTLRTLFSLLLVVIICCSICPFGAAAEQVVPDFNKVVRIQINYLDGAYTLASAEVQYGRAPNLALQSGELKGSILDTAGKERLSFATREPGRAQGDILGDPEGRTLIGYTEDGDASDMSITVPWVQDMAGFTLTDSRNGALLVSADLTPAASLFCADYPGDPDCQARGAPSQLAAMEPVPETTSLPVVFVAVFSVSVFLAAGLAIMTVRRRTAATGIPEVAAAASKPVKQTVLIVDDDPEMVEIIHQFLTDEGYATIHALSGKGCLDILKKQLPDLILLDVLMQPMNGWETLEQIKKDPITKPIPVLMLTGKRLTSAEAKQYNICIDDYITKPFKHEEIFAAIDNILQRKQRFRDGLELAKKVGVDREKFCELAKLSRRISVNKKIIDIQTGTTAVMGPGTPSAGQPVGEITVTPLDPATVTATTATTGTFSFSGLSIECGPTGAQFTGSPVTVSFTMTAAQWADALAAVNGNTAAMTIQTFDPVANAWVEIPTVVDPVTHTVSAQVTHFSMYAVFYKSEAAASVKTIGELAQVTPFQPRVTTAATTPAPTQMAPVATPTQQGGIFDGFVNWFNSLFGKK